MPVVPDPRASLVVLAPDIWAVESHLHASGMHVRVRMTVVRLPGGQLWIHSPVPFDERLAAQVDQLGAVEHIIAPSRFHHLFAPAAKRRYPQATLWAAPTLPEKRRDVVFDQVLVSGMRTWEGIIDVLQAGGIPFFSEIIFLHIPSRTLVCTDYLFNIQDESAWLTRSLYRALGVWRRFGQSRVWRSATRDRAAAAETARIVLGWGVERVVMAHGDILEDRVQERLRAAFTWLGVDGSTSAPASP